MPGNPQGLILGVRHAHGCPIVTAGLVGRGPGPPAPAGRLPGWGRGAAAGRQHLAPPEPARLPFGTPSPSYADVNPPSPRAGRPSSIRSRTTVTGVSVRGAMRKGNAGPASEGGPGVALSGPY